MDNDGILECLALNARISGAELNQCDWGVYQEKNPKVATEI